MEQHDVASIGAAAHATQQASVGGRERQHRDAASQHDRVDEIVAATLAVRAIAEFAEAVVGIVHQEATVAVLDDGTAGLADVGAVAVANLAAVATDIVDATRAIARHEAAGEARRGAGSRPPPPD